MIDPDGLPRPVGDIGNHRRYAVAVLIWPGIMIERLLDRGITDRPAAQALTVTERDEILGVGAWSGYEDKAWEMTLLLLDPHPVGSVVQVRDYDGTVLGPYTVVRSYWPAAVCELYVPGSGMVRQNHDRILPHLPHDTQHA